MSQANLLKRIGVAILIMTILGFVVVELYIKASEQDSRVINYAGIVRGMSQRSVKLSLVNRHDESEALAGELDKILTGLQNGDSSLNLRKLDDKVFQDLLARIQSEWVLVKNLMREHRNNPEVAGELVNRSEGYFILTNEAVGAAEIAAKNRVILTEIVQIVLFVLELVALFVLRGVTKSRVVKPLVTISKVLPKAAAGDMNQRLPMRGVDEFGQIADVFNKMMARQQELTTRLESKVKEKTKDLEDKLSELEKAKKKIEDEKSKIEDLAEENEKFRLALDNATDHVVITDVDGNLIYANRAAEKITGYTLDEMIGKKVGKLWGGHMEKEFYDKMWNIIKVQKKAFFGKLKNKRKNGEMYDAEISVSPILDKSGEPVFFVGIERDITKELAIDRSKTEFVSVASHQLRTPLTAIGWYAEILLTKKGSKLTKKQKEYLREISAGHRRMVALVNDLLSISRLEMGTLPVHLEKVDLCKVVTDEVKILKNDFLKKKIKFEFTCPTKKVESMVDVVLFNFVIQNLLSNAVKYTPQKGRVKVVFFEESDKLVIIVEDSGIGIPVQDQPHVFEKFFRASNSEKAESQGTGLGLYIVKSIADFVGGSIRFESEEGKGAKFYFSLPRIGMVTKLKNKN